MVLRIKKLSANREANFNYRKTGQGSGGQGSGLVISNRFTYLAALHEALQNIGNQTKLFEPVSKLYFQQFFL
jgi:hypothetical protein